VALFKPIADPADLPPLGAGRESGTFDFKGSVDPAKKRELAKDVAAFANATGGVVLVGAVEDPETGRLREYAPMPEAFAESVKAAYDLAVANLCRPQPVIDAVRVKAPSPFDGFVVAVNVNPTPVGPVGVRWVDDPKCPSWAFPLRTTTHTAYLTPTELAMLMVPEVRRVMILLDSIPPAEREDLQIFHNRQGHPSAMQNTSPLPARLTKVDITTITVDRSVPHRGRVESTLPIDRVTSVWRDGTDRWAFALDGGIYIDALGSLRFTP
jgi:hypothetical protein